MNQPKSPPNNSPKSIKSLFFSHKGKVADKWGSYLDVYEEELAKYRQTKFPILEIGVQNCGSLEIWAKYFYNSQKILGVDIVEGLKKLLFEDERIEILICDSNLLHKDYSNKFNYPIIIHDASHQSNDIINTFLTMFPLLRDGDLYVAEDLCCSYWKEFNNKARMSSIAFFKLLADIINFEHWNQEEKNKQQIDVLTKKQFEQLLDIKNSIKSVRFYNSVCFIEKIKKNSTNKIRTSVVVGEEALLGFKAENGQAISDLQFNKRSFEFDDSDLTNKFNLRKLIKKFKQFVGF